MRYPIPPSCRLEHPVSIGELVHIRADVTIGKYSYVMPFGNIFSKVSIGRYCSIASNVTIGATPHPVEWLSTHPFQYTSSHAVPQGTKLTPKQWDRHANMRATHVGHDVWIGTNAVVMQGVTIGNGAVIGAGAVVTKDIPPYGIALGVPAKVTRFRFDESTVARLLELKWWELDVEELNNIDYDDLPEAIAQIDQMRDRQTQLSVSSR